MVRIRGTDESEWYVARTFVAPDGSVRVECLEAPNERGRPYQAWRMVAGADILELPGQWDGEPEFTAGGRFALTAAVLPSGIRAIVDPRGRTIALPARGAESFEAFAARVAAYDAAYRALLERDPPYAVERPGWALAMAALATCFFAASLLVLFLPREPPASGRGKFLAIAAGCGLLALVSVHDYRQEVAKVRRRREAREELRRLVEAGP